MSERPEGQLRVKDMMSRTSLLIDSHLPEIMKQLDDHQVVIVEAGAGLGKTTRIPQAALEHYECRIVMTQTRRAAVRWNGARIAYEMGCEPGELVGWHLRGDAPVTTPSTRLELMIDQTLINRIQRQGGLPEGIIIVDEAHERSVSLDLLLGLIKQYLPASPETKVIVTSATIDTVKFARYFDDAPVVRVEGRMHDVVTLPARLQPGEHHTSGAARAAKAILECFLEGTLSFSIRGSSRTVTSGTALVLLPGKEDISNVMASLHSAAAQVSAGDHIQIMSCHGESTTSEQDSVQNPVPEGVLRFVCGTEVLRNSVTVRQTFVVIDSLQVKRLIVDPKGVAHLTKVTVSRAAADQAKGRCGRTSWGIYIPVSFEQEYENLAPYPQPAILCEPITHVVLQVAADGLDIRSFPFLDRPDSRYIDTAITRLHRLEALDAQANITETGRHLLRFPIDPERATVLRAAEELGVLPEAIIAVAALPEGIFHAVKQHDKVVVEEDVTRYVISQSLMCEPAEADLSSLPPWIVRRGYFYELDCGHADFPLKYGARSVSDIIRRKWAGDSYSDFAAMVRAYRAFRMHERQLINRTFPYAQKGLRIETHLRQWCRRHFINFTRLMLAKDAVREICEAMKESGVDLDVETYHRFDSDALTQALVSGMMDNVGVLKHSKYTGPLGVFSLSYDSVCARNAPAIVVACVRKSALQGRASLFTDLAAPILPERLAEAVPRVCTVEYLHDMHYDEQSDEVVETKETVFVSTPIRQTVPVADDRAATRVFAEWLAAQHEIPGCDAMTAVLRDNRALHEARERLKVRAGATFADNVADYYTARLKGVRRLRDVANPEVLRLPLLNTLLLRGAEAGSPDTVYVLGRQRRVMYAAGDVPYVIVYAALTDVNEWERLPNEGFTLPDGRAIAIEVNFGGSLGYRETDMARLKARLRHCPASQ